MRRAVLLMAVTWAACDDPAPVVTPEPEDSDAYGPDVVPDTEAEARAAAMKLPADPSTKPEHYTEKLDQFDMKFEMVGIPGNSEIKPFWMGRHEVTQWNYQTFYIEVWLEKEALAGVLNEITSEYDVAPMVTRGFPSETFLYEAASFAELYPFLELLNRW